MDGVGDGAAIEGGGVRGHLECTQFGRGKYQSITVK